MHLRPENLGEFIADNTQCNTKWHRLVPSGLDLILDARSIFFKTHFEEPD